jgi:hypothetical protein
MYILAFLRFPTLLSDRHITIYINKGLDVCPALGFPGFFRGWRGTRYIVQGWKYNLDVPWNSAFFAWQVGHNIYH